MRRALVPAALALVLALGCGDDAASGVRLSAAEVVDGLRAAGLPVEGVVVYDESSDPNELLGRPGQYTGKAAFTDARVEGDPGTTSGGDVETFDDDGAQEERVDYLAAFADSPLLGYYQYDAGNAVLRLTRELTPDQAGEYEAALEGLFG